MSRKNSESNKSRMVMLTICVLSIVLIVLAFLYSRGILGVTNENLSILSSGRPAISEERSLSRADVGQAVKKDAIRLIIDETLAEREEDRFREEEGKNIDLNKYLVLVGNGAPITQEYIDATFDVIDVVNDRGRTMQLESRTWYYYKKLKKYLEKEEGIIIELDSGYRSIQGQWDVINELTEKHGAEYAWYYAAVPGMSEHHTGLAVDICLIVDGVLIDENVAMNAQTEIFGKIHAALPDFGFVLDNPEESWHIRFVGTPEIARAFYDSGISFWVFPAWYKANH